MRELTPPNLAPEIPPEDAPSGVDNSPHEEPLDDFYQSVSFDDLFGSDTREDEERGGVEESALESGHGPTREALPPRTGVGFSTADSAGAPEIPPNPDSLAAWVAVYYRSHVDRVAPPTLFAKRLDLERFMNFTLGTLGHDHVDAWVPDLTRAFVRELREKPSPRTGRRRAPASIRRCLATVRHFARWVGERHPLATDPLHGVPAIRARRSPSEPASRADLRRVWRACIHRVETCHRRDQDSLLEAAVFQILSTTGLRPHELSALDIADYHSKKLHGSFSRGEETVPAVWVPAEARRWLDRYLDDSRGRQGGPLFICRTGGRLQPKGVHRICQRLVRNAASGASQFKHAYLTPTALRRAIIGQPHGCPGASKRPTATAGDREEPSPTQALSSTARSPDTGVEGRK